MSTSFGARVGAIDLVDHDDRRQAALEGLAEHESRLRQRTFRGVDQQHHAVGHRQHALHFPAEIGVAGRVHDVDQGLAVVNGGVLGQDGDAALTLELVAVHGALFDALVGAEHAALPKHGVNKGGLAVIDVGDDGNVAAKRVRYRRGLLR